MTELPKLIDTQDQTVGELADSLYPGLAYDAAIPWEWTMDRVREGVSSRTLNAIVWGYPEGSLFGKPFPVTLEAYVELRARLGEEYVGKIGETS